MNHHHQNEQQNYHHHQQKQQQTTPQNDSNSRTNNNNNHDNNPSKNVRRIVTIESSSSQPPTFFTKSSSSLLQKQQQQQQSSSSSLTNNNNNSSSTTNFGRYFSRSHVWRLKLKRPDEYLYTDHQNFIGWYSPIFFINGCIFLIVPFAYVYICLVVLRELCFLFPETIYVPIQYYTPVLGYCINAMKNDVPYWVEIWCYIEALFYIGLKLQIKYLNSLDPLEASFNAAPIMDEKQRQVLWERMMEFEKKVPISFISGWFFDEPIENISKYDIRDFLAWSMFEGRHQEHLTTNREVRQLESFVQDLEIRITHELYGNRNDTGSTMTTKQKDPKTKPTTTPVVTTKTKTKRTLVEKVSPTSSSTTKTTSPIHDSRTTPRRSNRKHKKNRNQQQQQPDCETVHLNNNDNNDDGLFVTNNINKNNNNIINNTKKHHFQPDTTTTTKISSSSLLSNEETFKILNRHAVESNVDDHTNHMIVVMEDHTMKNKNHNHHVIPKEIGGDDDDDDETEYTDAIQQQQEEDDEDNDVSASNLTNKIIEETHIRDEVLHQPTTTCRTNTTRVSSSSSSTHHDDNYNENESEKVTESHVPLTDHLKANLTTSHHESHSSNTTSRSRSTSPSSTTSYSEDQEGTISSKNNNNNSHRMTHDKHDRKHHHHHHHNQQQQQQQRVFRFHEAIQHEEPNFFSDLFESYRNAVTSVVSTGSSVLPPHPSMQDLKNIVHHAGDLVSSTVSVVPAVQEIRNMVHHAATEMNDSVQELRNMVNHAATEMNEFMVETSKHLEKAEVSAIATANQMYETFIPSGSIMDKRLTAMSHGTFKQLMDTWDTSVKNLRERLEMAQSLSKQRHRIKQQLKGYRIMLNQMCLHSHGVPSKQLAHMMRKVTECNEKMELVEGTARAAFVNNTTTTTGGSSSGFALKNIPGFSRQEPQRYAKFSSDPLLGVATYPLGFHLLVLGCTEIPLRILLRKRGFERRSIGSIYYFYHPGTENNNDDDDNSSRHSKSSIDTDMDNDSIHGDHDDDDEIDRRLLPVVFIHGIGVGLLPYMPMIDAFLLSGRPIFLPEIPYVSGFRPWQQPNCVLQPAVVTSTMTAMLASHGYVRATWIGHSYGTTWLSYMCQYASTNIAALVFLDPICFGLHIPFLAKQFVYSRPDPGTVSYIIRTDVIVNWTIQRCFPWSYIALFLEQIGLDRPCRIYLSEKDALVPVEKIRRYLEENQIPITEYCSKLNQVIVPEDASSTSTTTGTNTNSVIKETSGKGNIENVNKDENTSNDFVSSSSSVGTPQARNSNSTHTNGQRRIEKEELNVVTSVENDDDDEDDMTVSNRCQNGVKKIISQSDSDHTMQDDQPKQKTTTTASTNTSDSNIRCIIFRGDGHGDWTERPSAVAKSIADTALQLCTEVEKKEWMEWNE